MTVQGFQLLPRIASPFRTPHRWVKDEGRLFTEFLRRTHNRQDHSHVPLPGIFRGGRKRPPADSRTRKEAASWRIDILTQISAAATALDSIALKLLEGHVGSCVATALASGDEEAAAAKSRELIDAVERFARAR